MSTSTSQSVTQTQCLEEPAGEDHQEEEDLVSVDGEEVWGELLRTSAAEGDANAKVLLTGPADRRFVIGRAAASDVVLSDPHVSSRHCLLFRDDTGSVWVEDHSLSGTFVNGERVEKNTRKRINNGDLISLLRPSQRQASIGSGGSSSSRRSKSPRTPSANIYEFIFRSHFLRSKPCHGAINDKYEIADVIGSGSYATVRRGVNKRTGEEVAVKIVEKRNFTFEPERWQDQLKEIEMLKRLQHSGCVKMLDTYSTDNALYIVLEFIKGGELYDRIASKGKLSEKATQVLIKRLLKAVAYLHSQGIVHRDLKPENILLLHKDDHCYHVKVADFGVARLVGAGCKTLTGSMCYIAPEVLERRDTIQGIGTYAFSCDLWSIAVIAFVCLFGRLPFKTSIDNEEVMGDLRSAVTNLLEFRDPDWQTVSSVAKDFLAKLFELNTSKRLSAEKALDHPWIVSAPDEIAEETCPVPTLEVEANLQQATEEQEEGNPQKRGRFVTPPVPLFSQQQ